MKSILFIFTLFFLAYADDLVGCFSSVDGDSQGLYQYQTASWCADLCPDSPYIALTGGDTCYCLLSRPRSNEVDESRCDTACFGFGSQNCGGSRTYSVFVGKGTANEDDEEEVSSSSSSSSTTSSTSSDTSTSSSTSSSSSTSTSETTTEDSTTEEPASSTTDAPASSHTTVVTTSSNSQGSVVITVTQQASSTASSEATSNSRENDSDNNNRSSSNIGPIVGGVVGGVAGVVIIALLVFFFLKRRRQQEDEEDEEEYFDKPIGGVQNGSINRKYGTNKLKKSIKTNGLEMPMTNPFTHPSDNLHDSKGELVDPRLNPVMLGRRRLSEGSLADETDYSRKILQVANPDSS